MVAVGGLPSGMGSLHLPEKAFGLPPPSLVGQPGQAGRGFVPPLAGCSAGEVGDLIKSLMVRCPPVRAVRSEVGTGERVEE